MNRQSVSRLGTSVVICAEDMGSCPNYGPVLGALNNRCRIILRTQKGTIILTTTHMCLSTELAILTLDGPNLEMKKPKAVLHSRPLKPLYGPQEV